MRHKTRPLDTLEVFRQGKAKLLKTFEQIDETERTEAIEARRTLEQAELESLDLELDRISPLIRNRKTHFINLL